MKQDDHFKTLGVDRNVSADELKRAYRRQARKFHPDVSKEKNAEESFKRVQEAYEVLKDPEKRAAYERYGNDWEAGLAHGSRREYTTAGGGGRSGFDPFAGASSFEDFLGSVFNDKGRGRSRGAHFSAEDYTDWSAKGSDVQASITISLEEAYTGTNRAFSVDMPERTPDGRIRAGRKTLNAKIPAGIRAGQQLRLAGQGHPGVGGGTPGDLFLEVSIQAHPRFEVRDGDVLLKLPVTPWEAALGRSVSVPTLGGSVDLKIPPGSQSGSKLRMKGRGLPGKKPGDQIVELQVVLPAANSDKARELYQQMEQELGFDPRN